jgi:hypothetical protein
MTLGFTKPLKEMSNRSRKIMFWGNEALPVRKDEKLSAICEPIV